MNFELTKEQKDIQKAAREFAEGEFDKDSALEFELKHEFPFEIRKKAAQLGFIGINFPEEYGGQGYGVMENVLVAEEFCRRDSGIGCAITIGSMGSELVLRFGREEQKKRYLLPLTRDGATSAAAFTEPDHGSDITFLSTTAAREGDEYVINGAKTFISNGSIAKFIVVFCQTDPQVKPTYRGISNIIVEAGQEGLEISDIGEKMGNNMQPTAELFFNNVRVPKDNLLGEENRGFYQTVNFFDESRITVAAMALGIAQGAFDRALNYAKEREQFGKKIAQFQVTQHKFADMATKIELARLITYKSAWNFDQGRIDPKLTSMAKWYASRIAVEVTDEAIQIFGGYGYILENEVARFYQDARVLEIVEGTREIQKNTIAYELMK